MNNDFPYPLEEDPATLGRSHGWSEAVYQDLLALQSGALSEADFRQRHTWTRAILILDMTDFTTAAIVEGDLDSLLRILDAQKVILPTLREHDASLVHCFADDVFAVFETPEAALDAALEVQHRLGVFNRSSLSSAHPTRACIGIGFGQVLRIGPDLAQGAEMNMASKLGEDVARGGEILLTENAHDALRTREDVRFIFHAPDEQPFGFWEVQREA